MLGVDNQEALLPCLPHPSTVGNRMSHSQQEIIDGFYLRVCYHAVNLHELMIACAMHLSFLGNSQPNLRANSLNPYFGKYNP